MDTTGKTRAEIDAMRALAAKAYAEGAYGAQLGGTWKACEAWGRQWAEEELPYPQGAER